MGFGWTVPGDDVGDALVQAVGTFMEEQVTASGGKWTGSIHDIARGLNRTTTTDEDYGTMLRAVDTACRRYDIMWEKAGRNGRHYTVSPTTRAKLFAPSPNTVTVVPVRVTVELTCPGCGQPHKYEITLAPSA